MAYKGRFRPQNISKYKGDFRKIIYRSLWELEFMKQCDRKGTILQWSSEEIIIPYKSPIDGKWHRYFPDFWIKTKLGETLIEVKPKRQLKPPKPPIKNKKTRKYFKEVKQYGINEAKWNAAKEFCENRGWDFKFLTEDHLTK